MAFRSLFRALLALILSLVLSLLAGSGLALTAGVPGKGLLKPKRLYRVYRVKAKVNGRELLLRERVFDPEDREVNMLIASEREKVLRSPRLVVELTMLPKRHNTLFIRRLTYTNEWREVADLEPCYLSDMALQTQKYFPFGDGRNEAVTVWRNPRPELNWIAEYNGWFAAKFIVVNDYATGTATYQFIGYDPVTRSVVLIESGSVNAIIGTGVITMTLVGGLEVRAYPELSLGIWEMEGLLNGMSFERKSFELRDLVIDEIMSVMEVL